MGRSSRIFKKVKKHIVLNTKKRIVNLSVTDEVMSEVNSPTVLNASASKMKIGPGIEDVGDSCGNISGFRIIDLCLLSSAIKQFCSCGFCGENNCLKVCDDGVRSGIVCTLHIICEKCGSDSSFKTSGSVNWCYEANLRMVYGMRCVGIGQAGSKLFCSIMNMPAPPSRYSRYNNKLHDSLEVVAKESMDRAAKKAIEENLEVIKTDIAVSCDNTWMKRGHTSLYGVSSVISVDSGQVLDIQVLSKFCHVCANRKKDEDKEKEQKWNEEHKKVCSKTHSASSGNMEPVGLKMIFSRSVEKYGVRYLKYLGDGDSSAFKTVFESEPYGPENKIEKLECIGHIQKRMGGRLLKLCNEMKGKVLEDGKKLGGKGRLTKVEIGLLQKYYGRAIRNNIGNVREMQRAVWATYFHKISTDDKPHHQLCPSGETTWCQYNKNKNNPYSHKHNLPVAVMETIKPVYQALANPELLKKCIHGKTQNPNESFNSLIWKRCPKTSFVSSLVVKIATYDAAVVFNDGNVGRIRTLTKIGFNPGFFMESILCDIDKSRIDAAEKAMENLQKQARQRRNLKRKAAEDAEDVDYAYGQF